MYDTDQYLDFRPYMIDNPYKVVTNDYLNKVVDVFRKMDLRHLLVVNPDNGKLKGVITRKDIFRWMEL